MTKINKQPITWKSVVGTVAIAAGGIYYMNQEKKDLEGKLKQRESNFNKISIELITSGKTKCNLWKAGSRWTVPID